MGLLCLEDLEREVVKEVVAKAKNSVIDCGGGVVMDERNVADLKRNSKAVLLISNPDEILKRISRDTNRPSLKAGLSFEEEQLQALSEREPKYRAAADCIFDTTHLKPRQTAIKIIDHIKKKGWV